jgi:hypothetical protein
MNIQIPVLLDLIQKIDGNLPVPEIRVWCHPERVGSMGDDYYRVFKTFERALRFIELHPEAERLPLLAFRGWEINLWEIQERQVDG